MVSFTFSSVVAVAVSVALFATTGTLASAITPARDLSTLAKRDAPQGVLIGCYPGGAGGCPCPIDNFGDSGVLINVFPGYQCAYPHGACAWNDRDGSLFNIAQDNCPSSAPCPSTGCTCPNDNNGDVGVMINLFTGYQCAYPNGACTWDDNGSLTNIRQGNCPVSARCDHFSK
ncbi:hypothetical protein BXZ70DRAFT_1004830 [Cristinia sonorae]|uniref:Uncharacterized protein n=1 Tax=Cristinia sonorae TaxID=1940300 RepID=A0A8K0UV99_9AGAR|nr:hypothetical protein BXZ70DRAFT_1004830 [Cristinia sonorae]